MRGVACVAWGALAAVLGCMAWPFLAASLWCAGRGLRLLHAMEPEAPPAQPSLEECADVLIPAIPKNMPTIDDVQCSRIPQ